MNDVPGWEFESAMDEVESLRAENKKLRARVKELETALAEERQRVAILDNYANRGYYLQ